MGSNVRTRGLRWACAAAVAAVLLVAPSSTATTATADPAQNSSNSHMDDCWSVPVTKACVSGALVDFKAARANEGLSQMVLPTNFLELNVQKQLFVLTNIERVDRGLPPVVGLSSTLNTYAQQGANASRDPSFPAWATEGGSNWASTVNPLMSDFLWMYQDGVGSGNVDCTATHRSGCWGHRHNIIGTWNATRLMGIGASSSGGDTQLFLGHDSHDSADYFTWSAEQPYFSVSFSGYVHGCICVHGTASVAASAPQGSTITYHWKVGSEYLSWNQPSYTIPWSALGKSLQVKILVRLPDGAGASKYYDAGVVRR